MIPPLDGITVLDLSTAVAGPYAALHLAQMGATVLKIQPPEGDRTLSVSQRHRAEGMSYLYALLNGGKITTTVDLRTAEGQEQIRRLAPKADILIESFRPGTMDRWNLSAEALGELNPRLIYASLTGFGRTSRYASWPALDYIIQAMSGIMAATGFSGNPPTLTGAAYMDVTAGAHLAIAVLAALQSRARSGLGSTVEVAMRDVAACIPLDLYNVAHEQSGRPPQQRGNRGSVQAITDAFPALDGYVYIAAARTKFARQVLSVIGKPEVMDRPGFETDQGRWEARKELYDLVAEWTRTLPARVIAERLAEAGVPCGPVLDVTDVLADEDLRERGMLQDVDQPGMGQVTLLSSPFVFGGEPRPPVQPATQLGDAVPVELLIEADVRHWPNAGDRVRPS